MDQWQGKIAEILRQNKWFSVLLALGVVMLLLGRVISFMKEEEVEIISASETTESGVKLWVDVGGAVVNPGVYELEGDARVKDALLKAGGLNENADRIRIARSMNLAAKIKDGEKLYFAALGEEILASSGTSGGEVLGVSGGKINVNTASVNELDKLWGVGEARALQIIEGRPYSSIEELKTKGKVPSNVFERIKDLVEI